MKTPTIECSGWRPVLEAAGFESMEGRCRFRYGGTGIVARPEGEHWLVLTAPASAAGPAPHGLWKRIEGSAEAGEGGAVWRWDLPFGESGLPGGDGDGRDDGDDAELRGRLLDWGRSSLTGIPSRDAGSAEVEALLRRWAEEPSLSVEARGLIRQVRMVPPGEGRAGPGLCCELARLPLHFRLPPGRWRCLRRAGAHAQRSFRMVRIETEEGDGDPQERWVVSVDFGGAPGAALEALFRSGLQSMRWVVRWLTPLAVLLSDPDLDLPAVDLAPWR